MTHSSVICGDWQSASCTDETDGVPVKRAGQLLYTFAARFIVGEGVWSDLLLLSPRPWNKLFCKFGFVFFVFRLLLLGKWTQLDASVPKGPPKRTTATISAGILIMLQLPADSI